MVESTAAFGLASRHASSAPGAINTVPPKIAFDEDLTVRLKHGKSGTYREDRSVVLSCKMSTETESGSTQTALKIVFTDSDDAFFYYSMAVAEPDYHVLKESNSLNVDFQSFPSHFVELLRDTQKAGTNLTCNFEFNASTDATFNVMESTKFREITLFSLAFRKGNDEAVKEHLASKMKEFSTESYKLRSHLQQSEESNANLRRELEQAKTQLSNVEHSMASQQTTVAGSHQHEIACLKEEHMRRLEEQRLALQEKIDREVSAREKETQVREGVERNLESTSKSLDKSESTVEDLKSKFAATKEQYDHSAAQEAKLREDYRAMEKEKYLLESRVARLEETERQSNEKLEGDRKNLTDLRNEKQRLIELSESQKAEHDEKVNHLEKEKWILRDKIEEYESDIKKQNEAIHKLNDQKRQLIEKVHKWKNRIDNQEKHVQALEQGADESKRSIDNLQKDIRDKDDEMSKVKGDLAKKESECKELSDQAKRNSETIEYLNKACNEKQMEIKPLGATGIGSYGGIGAYPSAPTSTYTRAVPLLKRNDSDFSFVSAVIASYLLSHFDFQCVLQNQNQKYKALIL